MKPAEDPTKTGHTFSGWHSDEALTIAYIFTTTEVTADLTLYAKWEINKYTVTFEPTFNGEPKTTKEVEYNNPVERPTNPTWKEGPFLGWFSDEALTIPYSFSSPVCDNITLYAKWDVILYAIIINENGGTGATWNAVEVVEGSTGYRLATEAQREYAARGGDGSPGGNFTYSGSNDPYEVGKKLPNGLGLYDMSGNVLEWVWDWYGNYPNTAEFDPTGASSGSQRVLRGGAFNLTPSTDRLDWDHHNRLRSIGIQLVVRTVED